MRFGIVILGWFALAAALAPPARAEGSVLVAGKASPRQREVIVDAVIATAREIGWSLKAHPFPDKEHAAVTACLGATRPWACIAPYMTDRGDRLVAVKVGIERTDTVLSVHVITAVNDTDSTASYFCNACDEAALKAAASDVTRRMLRTAAERSGKTRISIKSKPDRAWINLDGTMIGSSDTIKATYPGEHTIMLTHSGYLTTTRTVVVKEGETAQVIVNLEPVPGSSIDRPGDRRASSSRVVPKLLTGAGAAALIGGAVYSFTVDPPPGGKQPRYLYSVPALGVAAAGGAALGIGLYLWLRPGSGPATHAASAAPTVTPHPRGGVLGWSMSF
jgi:hypothetical protein